VYQHQDSITDHCNSRQLQL